MSGKTNCELHTTVEYFHRGTSLIVSPSLPLKGEFGIVYKAQLTEMKEGPSLKAVAVKTLKG